MQSLYRLIYYSRNIMTGPQDVIADEIRQILATSRRNNDAADLTGALMFNSGCFAQILEGPRAALEETFERIQRDMRHGAVVVLEYGPVASRSFPKWSMAFVGENAADSRAFGQISGETFDPAHATAEAVFQALYRLVREEEAVSAA